MSDMGTCLFVKAVLQKQQKGLPDDLFRLFTGIGKNHWMLTEACSFTLLIHHATILKNWNGKTYVRALVRYVSSVSITVRPSQNSNLATPMNKSISVQKNLHDDEQKTEKMLLPTVFNSAFFVCLKLVWVIS